VATSRPGGADTPLIPLERHGNQASLPWHQRSGPIPQGIEDADGIAELRQGKAVCRKRSSTRFAFEGWNSAATKTKARRKAGLRFLLK
jgi:hypothetical protein